MECPKCGRMVPEERSRCIYCGERVAAASPSTGHASDKKQDLPSREENGGDRIVLTSEIDGEEKTYVSLDHLPESLRKEVEGILKKQERGAVSRGEGLVETALPEDREGSGALQRTPNLPPGFRTAEEYIEHQLNLIRSERKPPINKLILTFILFASMALGGLVVWVLR